MGDGVYFIRVGYFLDGAEVSSYGVGVFFLV
jgi:hypothetical protein